jgi:hypothetical protein
MHISGAVEVTGATMPFTMRHQRVVAAQLDCGKGMEDLR